MKTLFLALFAIVLIASTARADEADLPPMRLSIEGLLLHRSSPESNTIVTDQLSGAELYNANDLDFDWEFNLRLAFGVRINELSEIEVIYFGLGDWSDSDSLTDPGNNMSVLLAGESSGPSDDFDDADLFTIKTSSELHSLEVNYLYAIHPSLRLLVGFRLMKLDESAKITAFDGSSNGALYNVDTESLLLGGQIGAIFDHEFDNNIFVRGGAKFGVFAAQNEQDTFSSEDNNSTIFRDESSDDTDMAFLGEGELLIGYRVNAHISVFGGYRVLYLSNVATATEQFVTPVEPTAGAVLETSDVLYHGPSLGAEITW